MSEVFQSCACFGLLLAMGSFQLARAINKLAGKEVCNPLLFATLLCTIRGRDEAVVLGRRFATGVVFKAMTVVACGMAVTLIDAGIIGALNPQIPFLDVLYECASAFGTAGLSASVTPRLDVISRLLLCVTMFIGRVGPLSFGLSILMRAKKPNGSILPEGRMLIG